jgi:hypothetical protein
MFHSELSTPEENGQRPLTTKPPSACRARPAASAIDEAIRAIRQPATMMVEGA